MITKLNPGISRREPLVSSSHRGSDGHFYRRLEQWRRQRSNIVAGIMIIHKPLPKVVVLLYIFVYNRDMPETLKRMIRDIPDFPKKGILFRDITPLLADASGLALSIELLANPFRGRHVDLVVGAESRGFIFGTAVACCLSAGFALVRKPGKLPHKKVSMTYELEYGTDSLEMHADSIIAGQRVLIVDDVLATGGTMKACCDLVKQLGGELAGVAVLIELMGLNGSQKLGGVPVHSVLKY